MIGIDGGSRSSAQQDAVVENLKGIALVPAVNHSDDLRSRGGKGPRRIARRHIVILERGAGVDASVGDKGVEVIPGATPDRRRIDRRVTVCIRRPQAACKAWY